MAAEDRGFRTRDDASSIALLRGIRSGVADFSFIHRADACSAAPEDLVANLEPAPGTDLDNGGYNSVWFFYCPKRFKNAKGDHSGHRQRSIAGGDTCWHSESSPKPVKDLDGATVCNLSYGRKEGSSSRSFNRMGWCMLEYDDKHDGGGDHVLCKIYRSSSSLARTKSKPTTQRLSSCKRKAANDPAESLPTKLSHAQTSASVDLDFLDRDTLPLTDDQMTMVEALFSDEEPLLPAEEQQFQQYAESLLPAEEQQSHAESLPTKISHTQTSSSVDLDFLDRDMLPLLTDDHMAMIESLLSDEEPLLPAEEQQFQHYAESLLPAEEQQSQHNVQPLLPAEEQQFQFTIGELLGYHVDVDEFMISRCCSTPTAMVPPDVGFSEGLAF